MRLRLFDRQEKEKRLCLSQAQRMGKVQQGGNDVDQEQDTSEYLPEAGSLQSIMSQITWFSSGLRFALVSRTEIGLGQ
jgi:hypothetical protein